MKWLPLLLGLMPGLVWGNSGGDPDALWKIVHSKCVPHEMAGKGPAPCAAVDLTRHYAVLKDRDGAEQFLLIPTDRITGIEDAVLLQRSTPEFWFYAWQARGDVIARAPRKISDADVGLAINPVWARTQDQLHIHIDCVRRDVQARVSEMALSDRWVPVTLGGKEWEARRFDLREDPFFLVAGLAHGRMGDWSIAGVGAGVLLASDKAPAEGLLDHRCG